uniref:Amino acid permease n=1 Tax=Elaeophora elaphi TaxID=1147741 RepID=A0A0R3RQL9_9BILA
MDDNISDHFNENSNQKVSLPEDSVTTEIPSKIADHDGVSKDEVALRTEDNEGVSLLLSVDDTTKEESSISDEEASSANDDTIKPNMAHTNLELFEDTAAELFSQYLKVFTQPQALERSVKSANLGTLFGVYLPTVQHILGVTMFIRLFWVVGVAGLSQASLLLALCCLTTFITSISLSAIATNGEIKSGGAYYMLSRNLGTEFGTAIGILFYLGNAVAASMYLVGGVEILLIYIFPDLTIGGREVQSQTDIFGMMSHNLRIYATLLLLVEFIVVAMGVRFVQLFAPVRLRFLYFEMKYCISLLCVILSILSCFAGGIEKSISPENGQRVCKLGDHLLQAKVFMPQNVSVTHICRYCNEKYISRSVTEFCSNGTCFLPIKCVNGYPGFTGENLKTSHYMKAGEYKPGKEANTDVEVYQDVKTTFFLLLAIYFPAVTGILTGANMSGDLKNAQKSIPSGTLGAQLTTSFIYFALALTFGASIDGDVLRDKYGVSMAGSMVVANLAWPSHWILLIGSFTSTFGAALQCLCSAPRLLQCIAQDEVVPELKSFRKLTKRNEPFHGLLITTLIAELAILLGAMDHIAAVVDFFFLMCYAFINVICAMHSIVKAPNWRPRYKYYHWSVAVLGAFLCLFIMFTTHWEYAIVSCIICFSLYKYTEYRGANKEWGNGMRAVSISTAQKALLTIDDSEASHPKDFRPQLLLLFALKWQDDQSDLRYKRLLHLASQLKASQGLCVVVAFLCGNPFDENDQNNASEIRKRLKDYMKEAKLRGFAKTLVYGESQICGSISTVIQSTGVGALCPNTLLLKWPKYSAHWPSEPPDSEYSTFVDKLHAGYVMKMCLLVAKDISHFPYISEPVKDGYVDAYWIIRDRGFLGLIAHLLLNHKVWRGCQLRVIGIARDSEEKEEMIGRINFYLKAMRIDATVQVDILSDPNISRADFERTLMMEERSQMAHEARRFALIEKNAEPLKESGSRGPKDVDNIEPLKKNRFYVEKHAGSIAVDVEENDHGKSNENLITNDVNLDLTVEKRNIQAFSTETELGRKTVKKLRIRDEDIKYDDERRKRMQNLDRRKVHKMHTAIRLNALFKKTSEKSQLILLNLPKPPEVKEGFTDYLHYLDELTAGLPRVLFVRGAGAETLTSTA